MNIAATLASDSLVEPSGSREPTSNATAQTLRYEAESSSPEADSPMDSVSFSSTSSPERQMRLLGIKEAIDNGTYDVPASAVADAMLKSGM